MSAFLLREAAFLRAGRGVSDSTADAYVPESVPSWGAQPRLGGDVTPTPAA